MTSELDTDALLRAYDEQLRTEIPDPCPPAWSSNGTARWSG
ncbi:hypothetical protein ACFQZ4_30625 [Catellatospora coxensis]